MFVLNMEEISKNRFEPKQPYLFEKYPRTFKIHFSCLSFSWS